MEQTHKQVLFWVGTAFLVILSLFFLVSINQKVNTATTTNTVSFSGEGKIVAKPDVAVANLSILTEADKSKDAQDENSRKSKAIVDFLKKQGVEEKDIRTSGYNIWPQYKYPRDGKPQISGYQVNQTLEVKIRDLGKVSDILDGVVTAGVNQVNGLTFEIDDPDQLKAQARDEAIKDAKSKADELEGQLGVRLGRIINFTEGSYGMPTPMYYEMSAKGMGGGGGGPDVPAGENEVKITVTITYQIK